MLNSLSADTTSLHPPQRASKCTLTIFYLIFCSWYVWFLSLRKLGDNCIQTFHLRRYIVRYTVGNLVLRRRAFSPGIICKKAFLTGQVLIKGIYLSKALTRMKIFLYKQELLFCQGDGYFWPHCCMNNIYISHR